jgi:hypothetical protein
MILAGDNGMKNLRTTVHLLLFFFASSPRSERRGHDHIDNALNF